MPDEQSTDRQTNGVTVGGILKNVLQYGAVSLLLVAAFGYPAVHVQYSRFGLPGSFIPYDQALRAGVLPATIFAWFIACILLARWSRRVVHSNALTSLLLLPVFFLPIMAMMVGWLAGVAVLFYGIAWLVAHLVGWYPVGKHLWFLAGGLFVVYLIGTYAIAKRDLLPWRRGRRRSFAKESLFEGHNAMLWVLVILGPPFYGAFFAGLLYFVRKFLEIIASPWAQLTLLHHVWRYGFILGAFVTLALGLLGT